jgi:hypothetical protein
VDYGLDPIGTKDQDTARDLTENHYSRAQILVPKGAKVHKLPEKNPAERLLKAVALCHVATPRRSRLVGAGPSMHKRSSSSHPGEPRHLLLRIYRSPTASGGQQHSTEYGVRSPGKAASSIPFLPCISSNLHIFSGSVKAARQHFFSHGWPLDQLPNRTPVGFPAANPLVSISS